MSTVVLAAGTFGFVCYLAGWIEDASVVQWGALLMVCGICGLIVSLIIATTDRRD